MRKLILICHAFLMNTLFINAQPACVSCQLVQLPAGDCFMSTSPCACSNYVTDYDYHNTFSYAGTFNFFDPWYDCQPWRFLMCDNNCQDNPHFNYAQNCNIINNGNYSFINYPRITELAGAGRRGSSDACVEIQCCPDDEIAVTNAKSSRSEFVIRPYMAPGKTYWYAWSFKLPTYFNWDSPSSCSSTGYSYSHFIIGQSHHYGNNPNSTTCPYNSIPFNLNLKEPVQGQLAVGVNFGAVCSTTGKISTPNLGDFNVELDKWYDVVMGITWSPDPLVGNIEFDVYKEGVSSPFSPFAHFSATNASMFVDDFNDPILNNFQIGIYRGEDNCTCTQIQIDEFSMATKRCCLHSIFVQRECDNGHHHILCPPEDRLASTLNTGQTNPVEIHATMSSGEVNINFKRKMQNVQLQIADAAGRVVINNVKYFINDNYSATLDISMLLPGVYFVSARGDNINVAKLVKL